MAEPELKSPRSDDPHCYCYQARAALEESIRRLRTQLAEAKAEAAPLRAAVDAYVKLEVGQQMACYWNSYWLGYRTTAQYSEILRQRGLAFATLRAALSSDAGKGLVSPEVVEGIAARLHSASRVFHSEQGHAGPWPECEHLQCSQDRASLDALKGVE